MYWKLKWDQEVEDERRKKPWRKFMVMCKEGAKRNSRTQMPENGNKTNGKFKKLCQTTTLRSLYLPGPYMILCVCVRGREKRIKSMLWNKLCYVCRDLPYRTFHFLKLTSQEHNGQKDHTHSRRDDPIWWCQNHTSVNNTG